jgi:DNA-binding NtrC family response regulator
MIAVERLRCLVVDDDDSVRKMCVRVAETAGFSCLQADCAETALQMLEADPPDVVLTDLLLPDSSGLDLVRQAKAQFPDIEMAIMTGYASVDSAIEAVRLHAHDYIKKPFSLVDLKLVLQRMHDKAALRAENRVLREHVAVANEMSGIIGTSPQVHEIMRLIDRVKDMHMPVLITGESGTGKELVTRAIHERSSHANKPFVVVDCGALAPTLIESELFGHEKGAFTGANGSKIGLFQAANGGTIFLDEIGELPLEMQTKLLRVLQQKEVRPLGSNRSLKVDVRVIAATNRDLEVEYRAGRFRKDLFFRLNVVSLHLPALRDRRPDIAILVQHFLRRSTQRNLQVSAAAMEALLRHDWPGNIRELENCIERAAALVEDNVIDLQDLPPAVQQGAVGGSPAMPEDDSQPESGAPVTELEKAERETILRLLNETNSDKVLLAKLLGVSRATLYRKLKRYHIAH